MGTAGVTQDTVAENYKALIDDVKAGVFNTVSLSVLASSRSLSLRVSSFWLVFAALDTTDVPTVLDRRYYVDARIERVHDAGSDR